MLAYNYPFGHCASALYMASHGHEHGPLRWNVLSSRSELADSILLMMNGVYSIHTPTIRKKQLVSLGMNTMACRSVGKIKGRRNAGSHGMGIEDICGGQESVAMVLMGTVGTVPRQVCEGRGRVEGISPIT